MATADVAAFLSEKVYTLSADDKFNLPGIQGSEQARFVVLDMAPPNSANYVGAVIKDN